MGYSYNFTSVINMNRKLILETILTSSLWNTAAVNKLLERCYATANSRHKYARMLARNIYRLYLISGWYQHCKYLDHE